MGTEAAAGAAASPNGTRAFGIYLASMAAASVCVGLGVLVSNHYNDRARAVLLRHRTLLNRPAVLATDLMALFTMACGLLCVLARRSSVDCEVPTAMGIVNKKIETTGHVEAITLTFLSTCAMSIASLYSWHIYQLGCKLSSITIPKWKWYIVQGYIWLMDILPWLVYNVHMQVSMRTGDFHIVQDKNRVFTWIALGITVLAFVLHISINVVMVFRFIRGIKKLVQNTHILKEDRIAELHSLSIKSVVYIVLSLILYVFVWTAFMIYPINLSIHLTTTPYLLTLLIILQLCFNSRFLATPASSCLQPAPAAGAAQHGQVEDEVLQPGSSRHMEMQIEEMVVAGGIPPLGGEGAFSPTSWRLFGSRQHREQQRRLRQQREEEERRRQQQRKRSPGARERWRPWQLPEISHVFSNPWEIEKGMVFRISEVPSSTGVRPPQPPPSNGGGGNGGGPGGVIIISSDDDNMVSAASSAATGSAGDDDIATTAAVIHPEKDSVSDTLLDSPASSRSSSSGRRESGDVQTSHSPRRRREDP